MKLSTSLTTSTLLHAAFMVAALFGAWEMEIIDVEPASFDDYVEHTHHVQVMMPAPEPIIQAPAPLATSVASQERAEPVKREEPRGVKEPEKLAKVVVKKSVPPRAPEQPVKVAAAPAPPKTLKPIVATEAPEEAAPLTQQVANERDPVVETTAQALLPRAAATTQAPAAPAHTGSAPRGKSALGTKSGPGLGGGIDQDGLMRAYNKKLYRVVKSHTSAPRAARRARLEGTVYLLVTFDAHGNVLAVRVRKSSGHDVLDRDAIATLKRLGKLPAPPTELAWTRKSLTIPIQYKRS